MEELLAHWADGAMAAPEVKAFAESATSDEATVREVLAELDLLPRPGRTRSRRRNRPRRCSLATSPG